MIQRKLHPKKIYLADHESVADGTIATIAALIAHATAWIVPSRTQEDATLHLGGSVEDYQEQGSSGMLVLADRVDSAKSAGISFNMGRWSFEIEAMRQGLNKAAVENDHDASIAGADDSTAITGIAVKDTVVKKKFVILCDMGVNPDDGKTVYLLLTRCIAATNEFEQSLNHSQQNPVLRFDASLLESETVVTNYQALYDEIVDDGLVYWFEGKPDA